MISSEITAPSTVLTCGQLRLTIPASAQVPALNLRPGSTAVDVSFSSFTGTVTFDLVAAAVRAAPSDPSLSFAQSQLPHSSFDIVPAASAHTTTHQHHEQQQQQQQIPHHIMGLQITRTFSQSLNAPPPPPVANAVDAISLEHGLSQDPLSQVHNAPVHPHHHPHEVDSSSSPDYLSPSTQLVTASQPLDASQPFDFPPAPEASASSSDALAAAGMQHSQSMAPSSQLDPASVYAPSQMHAFSNPLSDAQPSQALTATPEDHPPVAPHFVALPQSPPFSGLIPSPPHSPPLSPSPSPSACTYQYLPREQEGVKACDKGTGDTGILSPHPSSRTRVEGRTPRHGKRVRFEENPIVGSTPPLKKPAISASPPLAPSCSLPPAAVLPVLPTSRAPKMKKGAVGVIKSKNLSPVRKMKLDRIILSPPASPTLPPDSPPDLQHESSPLADVASPRKVTGGKTVLKREDVNARSKKKATSSPGSKAAVKSKGTGSPGPKAALKSKATGSPGSKAAVKSKAKPKPDTARKETKSGHHKGAASATMSKVQSLKPPSPTASPVLPSPWQILEVDESERPEARWGATLTPLDETTALLVGGENDSHGLFKDAVVFDVKDNVWVADAQRLPCMPLPRTWHSATRVDQVVLVFGGEVYENETEWATTDESKEGEEKERQESDLALVYDNTYRTWYKPSLTGTAPTARAGHCAALIPGTTDIVIFGGNYKNRFLNDTFVLEDLCNWAKPRLTSKSARPSGRAYATLTAVSEYLVLFGGNNKTKSFNDVYLFMGESRTWVQPVILGRTPKARTGHCAVPMKDGKGILVYGGWDDQGAERLFFSDVWMLRIMSKTECQWMCVHLGDNAPKVPGPRAGAAMCAGMGEDKGQTLLFGGWHQFTYFNDITQLDVSDNGRVRARCASR